MRKGCVKKKGLSQIISVVLIILIAVPAVFLLWTMVFPMITDFLLDGRNVELNILISGGYTVYDGENTMMSVHVERGNDGVDLEYISIAVSVEGTSTSYMVHSLSP